MSDSRKGANYYLKIMFKGSVAVTLAETTTKMVGVFLLPVYSYYLSPEDYGTASMVLIIVTFLGLLYNPGMFSATVRLYHDTEVPAERQEIIGSAYIFFLVVPVVFSGIIISFGPYIFTTLFTGFQFYPYGFLAVILAFFTQPKRLWTILMTLQYKLHITAVYSIISFLLSVSFTLVFIIIFSMGALGRVLGMFPSVLLIFFLSFFTVYKYTEGKWSFKNIINQLQLGFPLIIAIWSYEILHIADRYIIERMMDLASVGIYSFAYQFASISLFFVVGIRQLWNPVFYENMNANSYDTINKILGYYIATLSVLNIVVLLFSKEVILILVNERYFSSIPIIGMIIIGIYFSALLTITNSILGYEKKFGTTSKIAFIASIINIGLNILLIPYWGIMGSAIATAIAYFIYFAIASFIVRNTLSKLHIYKWLNIAILLVFGAYIIIIFFPDNKISIIPISVKLIYLILIIYFMINTKMIYVTDIKKVILKWRG